MAKSADPQVAVSTNENRTPLLLQFSSSPKHSNLDPLKSEEKKNTHSLLSNVQLMGNEQNVEERRGVDWGVDWRL